jgi:hypothetical protein
MRLPRILRALCALILTTTAIHAQTPAPREPRTIGIGANLNPTGLFIIESDANTFLPVGLTNILVAITPTPQFRIEPEIGHYSTSRTETEEVEPGGAPPMTVTSESTTGVTRLGTGIFYRAEPAESFSIYVGPRVGVLLASTFESMRFSSSESTRESSETDLYVGLASGGEYMLGSHFSLGVEVQFNYVSFGTPTVTLSPAQSPDDDEVSRSALSTNALVAARFYF